MDGANIIRLDRARWPWDRYSRHWLSEQGSPAQQRRLLRARKEIASSGIWLALAATRDVWAPEQRDPALSEGDEA